MIYLNGSMIAEKIIKHKEIYENAGLEVPPYRLLYSEQEELKKYFKIYGTPVSEGLIAEYFGVKIEIVVEVK